MSSSKIKCSIKLIVCKPKYKAINIIKYKLNMDMSLENNTHVPVQNNTGNKLRVVGFDKRYTCIRRCLVGNLPFFFRTQ